jgi:hypothetical protein
MLIRFLVIAFLISSLYSYGQKCKYEYKIKDEVTGKIQQRTSAILAGSGPAALRIIFEKEGERLLVGLHLVLSGRKDIRFEQGDTLSLTLENGEILLVRTMDQYFPLNKVIGLNVMSVYSPLYAVSDNELKKLTILKITAAKIKMGSLPLMVEVSLKKAQKTKTAARCILL